MSVSAPCDLRSSTSLANSCILSTMSQVTEKAGGFSERSDVTATLEVVQDFHSYAAPEGQCERQTADGSPQTENEILTEQFDVDQMWEEHYAEVYWYYYNQYMNWYTGCSVDELAENLHSLDVHGSDVATHLVDGAGLSNEQGDNLPTICADGINKDGSDEELEDGSGQGKRKRNQRSGQGNPSHSGRWYASVSMMDIMARRELRDFIKFSMALLIICWSFMVIDAI